MDKICNALRTFKKHPFLKTTGRALNRDDYDCTDSVKETFSELTQSTKYAWGNNEITFYSNENTDPYMDHVAQLLYLIQPPNTPLIAHIILSSAKKFYPKNKVFGREHVNTGYTDGTEIVVYRKEEWFKVFIHECFHFFKYDHLLFNTQLVTPILQLFPVKSSVNLYESYCEIWARTLNCCMTHVHTSIPLSELLQREKKHSVRHMVNVLRHMNLTYKDIQLSENIFREETNVLAYVVLGAILMHHDFISKHLIHKRIDDMFELKLSDAYVSFIRDNYKSTGFLETIQHIESSPPKITTTMSIVRLV